MDEDEEAGEPGAFVDDPALLDGVLCNVVPVTMNTAPMVELDAGDLTLQRGDRVVVEADRGSSVGVVIGPMQRRLVRSALPRVLRPVEEEDPRLGRSQEREREAMDYCRDRVRSRSMPMKLISAEYLQTGNKLLFYFAAENRVDFRDLVKDLARRLHARIEMRQVGVRDESRMSSGLGPCGQTLCCSTWITAFQPVSIRMAKDQNLVLNPTKVSGMCGRLKCCLAYEQALYREARKALPKVGQRVETPAGGGRVHEIDIPRRLVRVLVSDGTIESFSADVVTRSET